MSTLVFSKRDVSWALYLDTSSQDPIYRQCPRALILGHQQSRQFSAPQTHESPSGTLLHRFSSALRKWATPPNSNRALGYIGYTTALEITCITADDSHTCSDRVILKSFTYSVQYQEHTAGEISQRFRQYRLHPAISGRVRYEELHLPTFSIMNIHQEYRSA